MSLVPLLAVWITCLDESYCSSASLTGGEFRKLNDGVPSLLVCGELVEGISGIR